MKKSRPNPIGPNRERKRKQNAANKRERRRGAMAAGKGRVEDPEYLRWIRTLPCVVCQKRCKECRSGYPDACIGQGECVGVPVQAAHVGLRGLRQKCSDREAIPLCNPHHNRGFPESQHTLGKNFWSHHGIDREEIIRTLNEQYDAEQSVRVG